MTYDLSRQLSYARCDHCGARTCTFSFCGTIAAGTDAYGPFTFTVDANGLPGNPLLPLAACCFGFQRIVAIRSKSTPRRILPVIRPGSERCAVGYRSTVASAGRRAWSTAARIATSVSAGRAARPRRARSALGFVGRPCGWCLKRPEARWQPPLKQRNRRAHHALRQSPLRLQVGQPAYAHVNDSTAWCRVEGTRRSVEQSRHYFDSWAIGTTRNCCIESESWRVLVIARVIAGRGLVWSGRRVARMLACWSAARVLATGSAALLHAPRRRVHAPRRLKLRFKLYAAASRPKSNAFRAGPR